MFLGLSHVLTYYIVSEVLNYCNFLFNMEFLCFIKNIIYVTLKKSQKYIQCGKGATTPYEIARKIFY